MIPSCRLPFSPRIPLFLALLGAWLPASARAQAPPGAGVVPKARGPVRVDPDGGPRPHPRLKEERPRGRREKLSVGTLFLPEKLRPAAKLPLFVHFHGPAWLPEVAAARHGRAVLAVHLGSGSAVYGKAFADPKAFGKLLAEAEAKAGARFEPVTLTAWSAGYGAVRVILRAPDGYARVRSVLLLDGLHAGYTKAAGRQVVAADLDVFVRFARDAAAGRKRFLLTHSEVFPGSYASTTETADYLLRELGLKRKATLAWGPVRMQQLGAARQGDFQVLAFAGKSAPDHVDHLHALPELLDRLDGAPLTPSCR
jgi:hypothetical protein